MNVPGHSEADSILLVDPASAKLCPLLPAAVVKEADLDVLLGDLLAQDDYLLAALSRGAVVTHVSDLKYLLGLGVIGLGVIDGV